MIKKGVWCMEDLVIASKVRKIMEENEETKIQIVAQQKPITSSFILYSNEKDTFMEFHTIKGSEVVIHEIVLENKRVGTLSSILNLFSKEYKSLTIVSVLTEEMLNFCNKNNFINEKKEQGFGYGNFKKNFD